MSVAVGLLITASEEMFPPQAALEVGWHIGSKTRWNIYCKSYID